MEFVVDNINFKYSEEAAKDILKDVSFSVKKGEVACIIGPSGSGKSTLVNILSGVIPVLIKTGSLCGKLSFPENAGVYVVSQTPENQLFGYGVEDAIVFGMENLGYTVEEINDNLEYVLNLLNIQHLRKRSIQTLSGGQRQAVCIASVLAMNPALLILDEPVSSLDPNGKKMVQSILNQLRAAGQTTIIADNNLDWFSGIVEHVIGIEEGKVVFDGKKEEFFADFSMQERLKVNLPQEVELYKGLKTRYPDIKMFYDYEGAKAEIKKLKAYIESNPQAKNNQDDHPDIVITVESLSKTFRDGFNALIDINASFDRGRVIAVIGQNGSGKTTLVKHLNGLIRPTRGRILYMGIDTSGKTVAQISKNIILVFQHPEHMLFEETVMREITFCARAQKIDIDQDIIENTLKEYDLWEDREELPVNLPMGKKHLLTILSVLFSSADVIILDEPTLGMDHEIKVYLEQIIKTLKESGKTVIIISHEIPLVFKVSDEILALNEGRKIYQGEKSDPYKLERVFEEVNIPLPPVVRLAKEFDLPGNVFSVQDFIEYF